MHCYLVTDISSFLSRPAVDKQSCIIALDYFVYSKLKNKIPQKIHYINEFSNASLIEAWQGFINNFFTGINSYLANESLTEQNFLHSIDCPFVASIQSDFNPLNVIPRLLSFLSFGKITSIEIIGSASVGLYLLLDDIAKSMGIKIANKYSSNEEYLRPRVCNYKTIKKWLSIISSFRSTRKKNIVFPDPGAPDELKKEFLDVGYNLAIINPSKETIKKSSVHTSFYFTGVNGSAKDEIQLLRLSQTFKDIDFTDSFFQLVELFFKKTAGFWYQEKCGLEKWIVQKEPAAVLVFDIEEVLPRLIAQIAKENSMPSFHFPHGFCPINKNNVCFTPIDETDYVMAPSNATKDYYVNTLGIEPAKVFKHVFYQTKKCRPKLNIKNGNIVILEYGLIEDNFCEDYSYLYKLPHDLIKELNAIYPDKKIIYRSRSASTEVRNRKQIRKHLKPLYDKKLFEYDTNKSISETCQTAAFIIGNISTVFFEAIASDVPYYCYNPVKLVCGPPFTPESPFVFTDIKELRDILSKEYPLQSLKDKYLRNLSVTANQIIQSIKKRET